MSAQGAVNSAAIDSIGVNVVQKTINLRTPEQEAAKEEYRKQRLMRLEEQSKSPKTTIVDGVSRTYDSQSIDVDRESVSDSNPSLQEEPSNSKGGIFRKIFN